jgi:hypothetical protein
MVHCGYDPSGALGTNYQRGDNWKNFAYNFGAKPRPCTAGASVKAYNGVTIGKGHMAEARAVIHPSGAKAPGGNGSGHLDHVGTFCGGTGDTSEREALLEKVRAAGQAGAKGG